MIKVGLRHNLIFPLLLIIFSALRKIDYFVMDLALGFNYSLLLTLLMFLGEIVFGFIFFIYQKSFLSRNKRQTYMGIKLIKGPSEISTRDKCYIIYLLIFISSFIDFLEFILSTYYLPQIGKISESLEIRLSSFLTLSSALIFIFFLKLPIFKHQIFSLITIFICLIIIITFEFLYLFPKDGLPALGMIFLIHFSNSLFDSIEKYLLEYNFLNPFKKLMIEAIFGFLITIAYSFHENPFKQIKSFYNNNDLSHFILLIILLVLYFLLSGGRNAYRVLTNKIYSPMTKSLSDYFLNPILIFYYYIWDDDFNNGEGQNLTLFIINVILSIVIVLCGCIYNEILVLFCFNLEYNTHRQVSIRAINIENEEEESSEDDDEDNNKDKKKMMLINNIL